MNTDEIDQSLSNYNELEDIVEKHEKLEILVPFLIFSFSFLSVILIFLLFSSPFGIMNTADNNPIVLFSAIFISLATICSLFYIIQLTRMKMNLEITRIDLVSYYLSNVHLAYKNKSSEETLTALQIFLKKAKGTRFPNWFPTIRGSDIYSVYKLWAIEWYLDTLKESEDLDLALDQTIYEFLKWNLHSIEFTEKIEGMTNSISTPSKERVTYTGLLLSVPRQARDYRNSIFTLGIAIIAVIAGYGTVQYVSGPVGIIVVTAIFALQRQFGG